MRSAGLATVKQGSTAQDSVISVSMISGEPLACGDAAFSLATAACSSRAWFGL